MLYIFDTISCFLVLSIWDEQSPNVGNYFWKWLLSPGGHIWLFWTKWPGLQMKLFRPMRSRILPNQIIWAVTLDLFHCAMVCSSIWRPPLDKSSLLILNQNYGMINVWTPYLSHTTPTQPNMHNGNGYYTVAECRHVSSGSVTAHITKITHCHCYLLAFAIWYY